MAKNNAGSKYNRDLSLVEIAKLVRQDIKDAMRVGRQALKDEERFSLPELKINVRKHHHNSLWIAIGSFPEGELMYSPERLDADARNDWDRAHREPFYSAAAMKVLDVLKQITNQYNYDNSDIQSDYFDVNFYTTIQYDTDLTIARRAAESVPEVLAKNLEAFRVARQAAWEIEHAAYLAREAARTALDSIANRQAEQDAASRARMGQAAARKAELDGQAALEQAELDRQADSALDEEQAIENDRVLASLGLTNPASEARLTQDEDAIRLTNQANASARYNQAAAVQDANARRVTAEYEEQRAIVARANLRNARDVRPLGTSIAAWMAQQGGERVQRPGARMVPNPLYRGRLPPDAPIRANGLTRCAECSMWSIAQPVVREGAIKPSCTTCAGEGETLPANNLRWRSGPTGQAAFTIPMAPPLRSRQAVGRSVRQPDPPGIVRTIDGSGNRITGRLLGTVAFVPYPSPSDPVEVIARKALAITTLQDALSPTLPPCACGTCLACGNRARMKAEADRFQLLELDGVEPAAPIVRPDARPMRFTNLPALHKRLADPKPQEPEQEPELLGRFQLLEID